MFNELSSHKNEQMGESKKVEYNKIILHLSHVVYLYPFHSTTENILIGHQKELSIHGFISDKACRTRTPSCGQRTMYIAHPLYPVPTLAPTPCQSNSTPASWWRWEWSRFFFSLASLSLSFPAVPPLLVCHLNAQDTTLGPLLAQRTTVRNTVCGTSLPLSPFSAIITQLPQ